MTSARALRPHEQLLASIERRPVSKARGWCLVLLACCRGVSAAGEAPSLDPFLAVQCRELVIADGKPGGGLIVSAQLPSSWEHRPGWTTWSEHGVIKRCDGSDDLRLWYSFVGPEADPARDPAVSLVGGRPARSHQSSRLLPDGARYLDSHQPRCLRHTMHHAIPFDLRLETYYEAGLFHEICRPVAAAGALTGWPSAVGKDKGKWGAGGLTCFYSAEALYALMLGVPQHFQVAVHLEPVPSSVSCFIFSSPTAESSLPCAPAPPYPCAAPLP